MPSTFAFKALDLAGVSTIGELEADDKQQVASQLRGKGLIVLDIEEKKGSADIGDMLARFKRVKTQELTIATRQLSTMVSSGMSLLRALYVLEEQTKSDKLKDALTQVRKDVEAGISLSDAMSKHPEIFNDLYIAMVEAGELGGILESTLQRVADQLEKDDSLRRQVKSAMMYPALIGGFALTVLLALVTFLVPVFEKIFKDFGGDLPAITKLTVSLARFSRTYSALIAAGVPMLQAIEITGRTAGNRVVEKAMEQVHASVKGGGSIAQPMRGEPTAFPSMVVQMVAVGEETGALETMLSKVADFYEDEVAASLKALTSILEPLMIVVVGAIVGFIVISMYMLYDQIR